PNNTAGQAHQWTQALNRERADVSAVSLYGFGLNRFQADVDIRVPEAVFLRAPRWHAEFEEFLATRTHVLWESGLPLLGRRFGMSVGAEVDALRRRGVGGGLIFHGSDVRPPSRHAEASPWSPFAAGGSEVAQ